MMKKIFFFLFFSYPLLMTMGLPAFAGEISSDEVKEHYRLGNIYYEHELYAQAQQEFKKALGENSELLSAIRPNKDIPEQKINKSDKMSPVTGEYLAGAGDTLTITVWENPDLTQEVIVRPDGKISFPLINEITVENRTLPQIKEEITKRLAEYIKTPNVNISLKQVGGNKVMVLGEVRSPGMYKLEQRKTVLEAIALAGGFGRDAVETSVIVVQGSLSDPRPQRLNLNNAMRGKTSDSFIVANQTIIFVPRKFIADVNYFMTELLGPISAGASTGSTVKSGF
jgi:polysaccharide export outer membrane protein